MKITSISARKILDSMARPTIEVEVNGCRASVPTGTSRSEYEAPQITIDLMLKRFNKLKKIAKSREFSGLNDIFLMEKDVDISYFGGNTLLALSLAILKALSSHNNKEVYEFLGKKSKPRPILKVIEGGKHADGPYIQEMLVIPRKFDLWEASEFFHAFSEVLEKKDRNFMHSRGMEGGWATSLADMEVLDMLRQEIDNGGYKLDIGLDIAATTFYSKRYMGYDFLGRIFSKGEMIDFVRQIIKENKIFYVEDPLEENDYDGFEEISRKTKALICGDDIFSTNIKRLRKVARAGIVKPNQVGSLFGMFDFLDGLKKMKMLPVFSHRSRETEDIILAHLAVGLGAPFIKIGLTSGERTAKLNELMRILKCK